MAEASPAVTEAQVLEALRVVQDPDLHRNIVDLGFVKNLAIEGGEVRFDVELTTPACPVKGRFKREAEEAVGALPGVTSVQARMTARVRRSAQAEGDGLKSVRNTIAIASGKGGVGKSTVAVNLAVALAKTGATVGLLDGDVYGPSVPHLLGCSEVPDQRDGQLVPVDRHGVRFISMGLLAGRQTPVIWRGPMATKLIQQFLQQVSWGDLDYLLVDLPPGTGDVQITLAQSAPLAGAVIVSTPQDVALTTTFRGLRMFEQVHVPIIGVVENMSYFVCGHCGERTNIFRHGTTEEACRQLGFEFLGEVPIEPTITVGGDQGTPVTAMEGEPTPSAIAFDRIARRVAARISVINEASAEVEHQPKEIRAEEGHLVVEWQDGLTSRFPFRWLRLRSSSAEKSEEADVPEDVEPVEVRPVGRYAIQPVWSDGHTSGIYTFNHLRRLAEELAQPGA